MISRCTIVVPCYNEAKRLPTGAFREFLARTEGVSFLFVNDGSTDNTLEVLNNLCKELGSRVQVLDRTPNAGKGEAVRAGMQAVIAAGGVDVVGFWDADLATPLEAIVDLAAVLEERPEIQCVFGARVRLLGRFIQRNPLRHYLGRVFATTVSIMLGLPIYDTQCGAKLFRVTPALHLCLDQPFLSRWVFDVEILARMVTLPDGSPQKLEQEIYEYPLRVWTDVAGSKVRPRDFFRAFRDVMRIYLRYLA